MTLFKKILLFGLGIPVAALALQSAALATAQKEAKESWEYYASDEDETRYSYDTASVERLKDKHVTVWVLAVYPETNPKYKLGRFQWELDCANRKLRGLQAYATKKDGASSALTEKSGWSGIPAGSTAETLMEKVCAQKKKKP